MEKTLVTKLKKINEEFYRKSADDFDSSRNYSWEGWNFLWEKLEVLNLNSDINSKLQIPDTKVSDDRLKDSKSTIQDLRSTINDQRLTFNVLDVGCGNGRFGKYISEKLSTKGGKFGSRGLNYIGIDFSNELLKRAEVDLKKGNINYNLIKANLLSNWEKYIKDKFDLIMCSAVLHHIPGFDNRKQIISKQKKLVNENGIIVITVWRFPLFDRFKKIILNNDEVRKIGVEPNKLEQNDCILSWNRGTKGFRYCHYTDEKEMFSIVKSLDLEIVDSFLGDREMNKYYLIK